MIQDILQQVGYPTSTLVLDVETYHDKDFTLKKLSTYEYVTDKRFEVLGWAAKQGDRNSEFFRDIEPRGIDWLNTTIIHHNASFDALVLKHHYGIEPPFIIDTLDLARHIESRWKNSLAALCERHKLPAKGDTDQFKGLHKENFTDEQSRSLIDYATNDADRTYDLLQILLPKLSCPKTELAVMKFTRGLFLSPILRFNAEKAADLKQQMRKEITEAIERTGLIEKQVRGNKSFERYLREELDGEEPPTKIGKKGRILAIAKTDSGRTKLLAHPKESVRYLMEARVAVKSWPLHIRRIERMEKMALAADGKLAVPIRYYGAHTGRWSGGGGINLQNLPARGHPLINKIRSLIEAPPGHMLIILDFSQVEARDLAWLAHQDDLVQAFAEGREIYCEFATQFIGRKVRKPRKTDSEAVAKWYGKYRQMGKIGVLGAGYGMGANQCRVFAKNTYKIDLTPQDAERLIKLYRRRNKRIVKYWGEVERAFRRATQNPGSIYGLPYGVKFFRDGNTTVIQLPNERCLYYIGACVSGTTEYPQLVMPNPMNPIEKIPFWGGYICENIVQASSRDILVETILRIEKELNLKIALTVHDDISVVVPETDAEECLTKIEAIARTPPAWCKELPLDVESCISKEYKK